MNTFEQDMYDQNNMVNDEKRVTGSRVSNQGKIKLVEINGETVSIVDSQYILQLEIQLKRLQNQVHILEHELRQTRAKQTNLDKRISETSRILDNKVSYE